MTSIAVAYLNRKGNPPEVARAFLKSLIRHPAGVPFELCYILKGYAPGETDPVLQEYKAQLPCKVHEVQVSDQYFMINALLDAAALIPHEFYFPLGSWSVILADNWLKNMFNAYQQLPNCGAVGATGSHESLGSEDTPFPNTHIRTTAFLMKRQDFLAINPGPLKTKFDNNLFEAGPNSMTQQLLRAGKQVVVVGRNGKIWLPKDWQASRTFRSGQQENLMVADNRTFDYQSGKTKRRYKLARFAWNNKRLVAWTNPISRFISRWRWQHP